MRHRLFNLAAAAVALTLGAATLVLWARSYRQADRLYVPIPGDHAAISSHGRIWLLIFEPVAADALAFDPVARIDESFAGLEPLLLDRSRFGFVWSFPTKDSFGFCRIVAIPHAVAFVALAVPPGIAGFRRVRRWRRVLRGCCGDCGYDVRATPGRCSECGSPLPNARAGMTR